MSGIKISNLCKNWRAVEAVKNVSFTVPEKMLTIENSEARILVADHSKLDRFAPVITGDLTDVDFLKMDFISDPIRQLCLQLKIEMFEAVPAPESASC